MPGVGCGGKPNRFEHASISTTPPSRSSTKYRSRSPASSTPRCPQLAAGLVARNSSKPGRPPTPETWVLHGSADWSRKHVELSADQVARPVDQWYTFWQAAGLTACTLGHIAAHRWRFAQPTEPLQSSCLSNDAGLVAAETGAAEPKSSPLS